MDPEANYKEQLQIAQNIVNDGLDGCLSEARRLAELVVELNEWLERGGFPPKAFTRKK